MHRKSAPQYPVTTWSSNVPPRNGMVRGFYGPIEMIREIPLAGAGADDAKSN